MSRASDLTYGSHLHLDRLLTAQDPVSDDPDEMLFIIQHQTSELWLKLILHELDLARDALQARAFRSAQKALGRVVVVLEQLVKSWDVLRTLTPDDFGRFRGQLGSASGFQSWQYRMLEYRLGNRVLSLLEPHEATPKAHAALTEELARPSLYHVALACLAEATNRAIPPEALRRDAPHVASAAVEAAWRAVYLAPDTHPDLYDLAERLVQVEDALRVWRFNHVTTVERVIGMKRGTGGTSGVGYLRGMLEVELFPELWHLRSGLKG